MTLASAPDAALPAVPEPLLHVHGVRKAFGRNLVLAGVSLDVHAGEAVAIVGENGSGKSTLLKILAGLETPDAGEVTVRRGIGYCPQRLELFDGLTVGENLEYFGAAYGLQEAALRATGRAFLDRFRFAQYVDTLVRNLSEGTKQKLNLTVSLLHDPELLLLDEPYQGFDYETFLNFAGLLRDWRAEGRAVLTISHLVTADLGMDRVLELREGTLHAAQADRHRS